MPLTFRVLFPRLTAQLRKKVGGLLEAQGTRLELDRDESRPPSQGTWSGGPRSRDGSLQSIRPRERVSVLVLAGILLLGGLFPRSFFESRERAARTILEAREE